MSTFSGEPHYTRDMNDMEENDVQAPQSLIEGTENAEDGGYAELKSKLDRIPIASARAFRAPQQDEAYAPFSFGSLFAEVPSSGPAAKRSSIDEGTFGPSKAQKNQTRGESKDKIEDQAKSMTSQKLKERKLFLDANRAQRTKAPGELAAQEEMRRAMPGDDVVKANYALSLLVDRKKQEEIITDREAKIKKTSFRWNNIGNWFSGLFKNRGRRRDIETAKKKRDNINQEAVEKHLAEGTEAFSVDAVLTNFAHRIPISGGGTRQERLPGTKETPESKRGTPIRLRSIRKVEPIFKNKLVQLREAQPSANLNGVFITKDRAGAKIKQKMMRSTGDDLIQEANEYDVEEEEEIGQPENVYTEDDGDEDTRTLRTSSLQTSRGSLVDNTATSKIDVGGETGQLIEEEDKDARASSGPMKKKARDVVRSESSKNIVDRYLAIKHDDGDGDDEDKYEDLIPRELQKEDANQALIQSTTSFNREWEKRLDGKFVPEDMTDHLFSKVLYQEDPSPADDIYSDSYMPNIFHSYRGGLPEPKKKPSPREMGMLGRPAQADGAGPEFGGTGNSLLEEWTRQVKASTAMQASSIKIQARMAKGQRPP